MGEASIPTMNGLFSPRMAHFDYCQPLKILKGGLRGFAKIEDSLACHSCVSKVPTGVILQDMYTLLVDSAMLPVRWVSPLHGITAVRNFLIYTGN